MSHKFSIPTLVSMMLFFATACSQETTKEQSETQAEEAQDGKSNKKEPHRYGGWYCPDNFGFVPVDIQKLAEVPAIADRLPTEEELHEHKSLINVDTEKYPDARALEMDLPKVALVRTPQNGLDELIIVIQAIVVQQDTVVGYRFANGGNGSAWISDVTFLSEEEVANMGSQPFFYSKSVLKANTADIWDALGNTEYFQSLGEKFDQQYFFLSEWNEDAKAHLEFDSDSEKASGFVGMLFGNYYLHIDYNRNGFHYSEKILISENEEEGTTELHVASGPFPDDFKKQKSHWDDLVKSVKKASEAN